MNLDELASNAGNAEAFLKILANKNRLMILCTLLDEERSVSDLNQSIPLGQSALSQHLAILRQHKLVDTRRDAQSIYYSVSDIRVKQIIEKLYEFFCN
ncbi:ArsR/SmtB family transcription factor [Paraglaciecola sp. 2405UD69-4]|uniref:ArsR/SmtB family transcription factor n=1 Tax=Paraglaciecola sp. 2405UD69-4 TaxID=3391836 RepID=UPI0039C90EBA